MEGPLFSRNYKPETSHVQIFLDYCNLKSAKLFKKQETFDILGKINNIMLTITTE